MSVLPSYWPVKAIQRPSGLKAASVSAPSELVRRIASPPSRAIFQRSLAWVKTMCVALTSGWRRKRVPWGWAGGGGQQQGEEGDGGDLVGLVGAGTAHRAGLRGRCERRGDDHGESWRLRPAAQGRWCPLAVPSRSKSDQVVGGRQQLGH